VGEFNGDTDPDLAVANELCHNVSVLVGSTGGSFTGTTNFAVGNLPDEVAVGEFSGDTDPELAVTNQSSDNVSVLVGGAGASFVGPTNFAVGDAPSSIAVGDFDDDSDADLAVANELSNNVSILLATSTSGYPRPKGASPLRVSLVPAYSQCTATNRTHGPPLDHPSCNPPALESAQLTVGSPDANGKPANAIGFARYGVIVGAPGGVDDSDVYFKFELTDVRSQGTLADYAGKLRVTSVVRITDRLNGLASDEPATVADTSFPVTVPCTPTGGAADLGATCTVTTSFDAVNPGAIPEGKRAIWELWRVEVSDGGADGDVDTDPNTLFATQGVFVP
jgi:hypothetical protein